MKCYLYIISFCLCFLYVTAFGQSVIKGTVLSERVSEPLPGVSVKLEGSPRGVITDLNGGFTLKVPSGKAKLLVSLIGFLQKDTVLNLPLRSDLKIYLKPDVVSLQEVTVSTGYQVLPKERATGSFSRIDQTTLNEQVSTDVLSRLEATANGLIVDRMTSGANGRLMIRGLSTISGPRNPLVVVDNFPYEGDIGNINPNDVEQVTVLKDAAAASVWGTRAGNGVIVITTKKGRLNQPLTVEFNSNVTMGNKPDLFYIPQISSSDFIDAEKMLYEKGFYRSQISSSSRPALSPVVELLVKRETAAPDVAAGIDARIEALRAVDVRNDFNRYTYDHSAAQQYALSLRGGSGIMGWSLSSGYDRNVSTLDAESDRLNLRFQNTLRPLKKLELSAGLYFTQSHSESGKPGYGEISSKNNALFPYAEFADADGNALPLIKDWRGSYIETAGNGKLLDWRYYPLEEYKHTGNKGSVTDVLVNVGLNYKVLRDLAFDVKYQYERQQSNGRSLQDGDSYFARNLVNSYTQIGTDGSVIYKVPPGGVLDFSQALMRADNVRGQLNYNMESGRHSVAAIAGGELRQIHTTRNNNRVYGYDDDNLTSGNVDYTTQYPNFITGTRSFIPGGNGIADELTRFVSVFANAAYSYNRRYTFSASMRRDASNLFGLHINDKWKPLWSAGGGWLLSDEPFWKLALLPYLKLRVTYGFSGNVDPSKTAVTTIEYAGLSANTLTPWARFDNYANPELKWETTGMLNLGMDFSTKGGWLSGSFEYYRKKGSDLFGTSPLDYTTGIGSFIVKNVAAMTGHGFDVELNSVNMNRRLKWTTSLNLNINRDRVTEYYVQSKQGSYFLNSSNSVSGLQGKPVYSVFSYRWAGLDPETGAPRGYLNGEVSEDYAQITAAGTQADDLVYHGSALPQLFGSLGNSFSYRGFSLSFRVLFKLDYYFRRESISYYNLYNGWRGHADIADRWKQPGDEVNTSIPAMIYPFSSAMQSLYTYSSPLVEKGDHIRLQYINMGYDLNGHPLQKLHMKSLRLFLYLNNPGILWRANKRGLDPDYAGSSAMPVPFSYSIGLRAAF